MEAVEVKGVARILTRGARFPIILQIFIVNFRFFSGKWIFMVNFKDFSQGGRSPDPLGVLMEVAHKIT
jgi:hypothetical protein